jgi:cytochrome o ubiquinol oxidase operon protein cyoD
MNEDQQSVVSRHEVGQGSYVSYFVGFVLSLTFTVMPYLIVVHELLSGAALLAALAGFAVAQLMVQLVFFLHLGRESKPRWNLMMFCFMVIIVTIIVAGTIWIMHNLDYNMTPNEMDSYMREQVDKGF